MPRTARTRIRRSSAKLQACCDRATRLGAQRARVICAADVVTGSWVRWKCQFGCGGFHASLMCPPHTPTPEQTRRLLDEYQCALLFEASMNTTKKIAVQLERELFLAGHYKALGLGSGPCLLCATCALADGCRHPKQARPAMEACGIDVFATVRKQGWTIDVVRNRRDPQHYFGLVLIE